MQDSKVEPTQAEKLKPPYGAVMSYSDFFDLCERLKIERVDVQFLRTHNISSEKNEYKVVLGLRFLGLLNEDGTVTERMQDLSVEGEPFKKALNTIVREAYGDLFETVKDLQKAKPEDIVNCLRGDSYQMSPIMARQGAKVFVFLAQKAGISLSQEIINDLAVSTERKKSEREENEAKPKKVTSQEKPRAGKPQHHEGKSEGDYVLIPEGMIRLEYQNKVLMFLPKGDKKMRQLAAKLARQFIETYEAESPEDSSIGSSS